MKNRGGVRAGVLRPLFFPVLALSLSHLFHFVITLLLLTLDLYITPPTSIMTIINNRLTALLNLPCVLYARLRICHSTGYTSTCVHGRCIKLYRNCVCFCQSLNTVLLSVYLAYWAFHSLHLDLNPASLLRESIVEKVMFYTLCRSVTCICPCPDYVRGFFLRFSPCSFLCLSTGVSWWWVPTLWKSL